MVVSLKSIVGCFPSSARRGRNLKKPVDRISTLPDDVSVHRIRTLPDDVPVDRISTLPDDIIHHILSLINVKYAIRTSALSKRWKNIYKSLPYFNLEDIDGILHFDAYYGKVINLLSNRDSESPVLALSLRYDWKYNRLKFKSMVKKVIHYAKSSNVNNLSFYDLYHNNFPDDLLKSKSLKHLRFTQSKGYRRCEIFTLDWYLPALVSLHLERATLGDDGTAGSGGNVGLFSRFENLKHLKLFVCVIENSRQIQISGPRLESLTLVSQLYNDFIKCRTTDWYLPALVSLYLEHAALGNEGRADSGGNVDLFSRFENLKNLKLIDCVIENPSEIQISGPRLESLTLVHTNQPSKPCIKCKTSDWYLPALVSLHLERAELGDDGKASSAGNVDVFSRFETLKHLKLIDCIIVNPREIEIFGPRIESLTLVRTRPLSGPFIKCKTSDWYLPALVSLHLDHAILRNKGSIGSGDLFSRFENLKHLKLTCILTYLSKIEISCPRLESLTLKNNFCRFHVSAPKLLSFCYDDYRLSELSMSGLLDISSLNDKRMKVVFALEKSKRKMGMHVSWKLSLTLQMYLQMDKVALL